MPPKYLQQRSKTHLKPCSERMVAVCDSETHAGCCKVPPCKLCLTLTIYGEDPVTGSAPESATGWEGTVGGYVFHSYWERSYEGVCEYVVEFDGEEVYRATCEEGASCRNPGGEVEVVVGYPGESATLEWAKYDPRELQLIDDPDTGCRTYFCDDCRCTCECLCAILLDSYGTELDRGELCSSGYSCEPPVWEGVLDGHYISLGLGRDQYGNCIITPTIDGIETDSVAAPGCASMSTTITLDDGTVLEVSCKECGCEVVEGCRCCPGWPLTKSGIIHWTSTVTPTNDCDGGISTIDGDFGCPEGTGELGTKIRFPSTDLWVRVFCEEGTNQWKAQYRSATSGGGFDPPASTVWASAAGFDFSCPDCADAVDGVATGTVDFVAQMACETSGGVVTYDVLVHGDIEIGC